jgi:pyruvate formate lyase activating enzyme
VGHGDYDAILEHTDLVLYDVKHFTPEGYRTVTGMEMEETLRFLEAVQRRGIPLWVRHVVVPGLTDGEDHIRALAQYVQTIRNVEKAELLGYHLLGRDKYRVANIPYPLDGVPALSQSELERYQTVLNEILKGVSET